MLSQACHGAEYARQFVLAPRLDGELPVGVLEDQRHPLAVVMDTQQTRHRRAGRQSARHHALTPVGGALRGGGRHVGGLRERPPAVAQLQPGGDAFGESARQARGGGHLAAEHVLDPAVTVRGRLVHGLRLLPVCAGGGSRPLRDGPLQDTGVPVGEEGRDNARRRSGGVLFPR
ncbi:hypothetical protein AN219_36830, partial [Streptomyces nanshensis]